MPNDRRSLPGLAFAAARAAYLRTLGGSAGDEGPKIFQIVSTEVVDALAEKTGSEFDRSGASVFPTWCGGNNPFPNLEIDEVDEMSVAIFKDPLRPH